MSRGTTAGVVVGVLVVGALAMLALQSSSTETEVLSHVPLGHTQDVDPTAAVVTGKRESGGFSILGLRLGRTTYRLSVQFFDAPGCFEVVSFGESWPTPFEDCSSRVSITGEISGIGTTARGESTIIGVDVEVPEDCYQAAALGETWPPSPACTHAPDR